MEYRSIDEILELLEDERTQEALDALDAIIAEVNDDATLHALRAFLLVDLGRVGEAQRATELAHALDDEDTYVLRAVGRVAIAAGEPDRAIAAARRLLELDAHDADALLLEARARALLGQWDAVESRCAYVLAEDPQNAEAAFLRVAAVESRKRNGQPLDADLWEEIADRFPHESVARSGRAWSLLQRGRGRHAEEEFRDALALDPADPWAREGLVLALKTRYPGYAQLLRAFFWLRSLPPRTRFAVLIGGLVGARVLRGTAEANPGIAWLVWPVLIAYIAFVALTWLADPLLNLVLMARPEGRRLLSADDQRGATAVGLTLAAALLLALAGLVTPWKGAMVAATITGFTTFTIVAAFNCAPGKFRNVLLAAAATFIACGLGAATLPQDRYAWLAAVGLFGAVASTWVSRSLIPRSWEDHNS